MADMSAKRCLEAASQGKTFTLEHPEGSIARSLDSWKTLEAYPGVIVSRYHACMFNPCRRRKRQVLIHNVPGLEDFIARVCESERICSRTKSCHLSWKPSVVSLCTGEEREYPSEFCLALAQGLVSHYTIMGKELVFLEVFSGPNAPLTKAVSEELGVLFDVSIPGGVPEKGVKREFRSLEDLRPRKQDRDISEMAEDPQAEAPESQYKQPVVELNSYRLAAVEAGRKPSYGKRVALIADGLDSPDLHLAKARCLKHPFQEEHVIKPDHRKALMTLKVKGNSISLSQLRTYHPRGRRRSWEIDPRR